MIDFENATFLKLRRVDDDTYAKHIVPMLAGGECIVGCYKSIRDGVVFTDRRIISVNVQGVTGKKKDFTSIPYNKIHVFSIETAGILDIDGELTVYLSGIGSVRFEFTGGSDLAEISRHIATFIM